MPSADPFLLRFAITRPGRGGDINTPSRYDTALDMTVVDDPRRGPIPVIDLPDFAGAMTKKGDIEKGEDQKDRPRPLEFPPRPAIPPRPPKP